MKPNRLIFSIFLTASALALLITLSVAPRFAADFRAGSDEVPGLTGASEGATIYLAGVYPASPAGRAQPGYRGTPAYRASRPYSTVRPYRAQRATVVRPGDQIERAYIVRPGDQTQSPFPAEPASSFSDTPALLLVTNSLPDNVGGSSR